MKFKKVAALLLAGAMCAASVVGCGKSDDSTTTTAGSDDTTAATEENTDSTDDTTAAEEEEALTATITVWSPAEDQSEDNGSWLQTRCDAFNEAHPNWDLTFNYATCSEGDAATTITTDPESAADVYMFANDQINKLIDAGAIAQLGGETEEYIKSTNSDAIVSSVTIDDGVYGVPFTTNTWYMFYDKRVYTSEDMVANLDEMIETAAAAGEKVSFPLTNSWYIASFYVGNGCSFFGDGTDESQGIDFEGDKATAVTDYLVDLVANENFINDADGAGIAGLKDGTVAAMFSGSWDYNNVVEALGAENVGVASLPTYTLDGEEKQMYAFAGSKAIAVNQNSENMQVAVKLALWLANEDSQQLHYELRNVVPCNTALLANITDDALVTAQNDTYDNTSIMQPFVAAMSNYWDAAANMGNALVAGTVTHDNAAEQTADMNTAFNKEVL